MHLYLEVLGFITGLWAEKFDHTATVTNFIITPLSFLSGVFYSIDKLPEFFQKISHINPFFYMIDGFRYGFLRKIRWINNNRLNLSNHIKYCNVVCCFFSLQKRL